MHNYNYVNTLLFGTVSFDSCSRFILCLYCFVYYVYDNPTYEVANKLICILYIFVFEKTPLDLKFFRSCSFGGSPIDYIITPLVQNPKCCGVNELFI